MEKDKLLSQKEAKHPSYQVSKESNPLHNIYTCTEFGL